MRCGLVGGMGDRGVFREEKSTLFILNVGERGARGGWGGAEGKMKRRRMEPIGFACRFVL